MTASPHLPIRAGAERQLHLRLAQELSPYDAVREGKLENHGSGWTRAPGGIDLVLRKPAVGIEVKLGKPEELLWDAVKIAQRVHTGTEWPAGVQAAALIVQTAADALDQETSYMLGPAPQELDVHDLIETNRHDWYSLMCGGRGIRPQNLPHTLRASATRIYPYESDPRIVLALRFFTADPVDAKGRFPLDQHGWPGNPAPPIPRAWRDEIDRSAARTPRRPPVTPLPDRTTPLDEWEIRIESERLVDDRRRLWAFVWAPHTTHPTSYRLADPTLPSHDLRISSSGAMTLVDPPRRIPAWCREHVTAKLRAPESDRAER